MSRADSILIVGAGLAGLFLALKLAPRRCVVLSQAPLGQASASAWAQGGLAAALAPEDNPALHAEDTIKAGAGLVDPAIAHLIAREGPARVMDLIALGVPFDRTPNGQLAQSLEAAHSRPRVVRVSGDLAGKAIMDALIAATRAAPHIEVIEGVRAHALLTDDNGAVCGVRGLKGGERVELTAAETILATGGVGGLFYTTTNPREAVGAGLGMAARAGALVADPEFIQFHPTAISLDLDPAPLATEALRGEGAKLVNMFEERFVDEFAPRDVVARAVIHEIAEGRGAFLDAREAVGEHFPTAFPTVFEACMRNGRDPRTSLIPIEPAAHYHMGGVVSDVWGRSTLAGLSVVGECASTGAHGANRLASNSLLEAVVFAHRIAERLRDASTPQSPGTRRAPGEPKQAALAADTLKQWRLEMTRAANVERNGKRIQQALAKLDADEAALGSANEFTTIRLILTAALARTESRGAHFRSDFPNAAEPQRSFLNAAAAS